MKLFELLILLKTYNIDIKYVKIDASEFKEINEVLKQTLKSDEDVVKIPDEKSHDIHDFLDGEYQWYLSNRVIEHEIINNYGLTLSVKLECKIV